MLAYFILFGFTLITPEGSDVGLIQRWVNAKIWVGERKTVLCVCCWLVAEMLYCWMLQAQQLTGVAVPSYYNPAAVNPLKYAEQLKKRKMLWSKPGKDTPDKEKEVVANCCVLCM